MSSLNEFESSDEVSREAAKGFALEEYVVEKTVKTSNSGSNEEVGTVQAKPLRARTQREGQYERKEEIEVLVPHFGDAHEFEAGERIIVGFLANGKAVALGVNMKPGDVPTQAEGERVIGHTASDTEVRLKQDGSVTINPGSSVTIEGDAVVNGDVDLGGTGGAAVARKGDAVDTNAGEITEGSSKVNAVD